MKKIIAMSIAFVILCGAVFGTGFMVARACDANADEAIMERHISEEYGENYHGELRVEDTDEEFIRFFVIDENGDYAYGTSINRDYYESIYKNS